MRSPPVDEKFFVSQGQALAFLSSPDVDTEVGDGSFVFLPLKDRVPPNPFRTVERAGAPHTASTAVFLDRCSAGWPS